MQCKTSELRRGRRSNPASVPLAAIKLGVIISLVGYATVPTKENTL